jgi:ribosomal protein S1
MATAVAAPSREEFAKLLEESFDHGNLQEGSVVKGTVVGIEKDVAVIDVGLKTEGRVALREFAGPGRQPDIKIGDSVEVYLERVENALGEAVLSRDKARREESWGKLEKAFQSNEKVQGVIFNQVKGGFTVDLDGAVAFLPRSQVDIRPIRNRSRSSKWIAAAATSSSHAVPCWRRPAPSSATSWCRIWKRARSLTAWSRTSPTMAPSSISAASTGCCT